MSKDKEIFRCLHKTIPLGRAHMLVGLGAQSKQAGRSASPSKIKGVRTLFSASGARETWKTTDSAAAATSYEYDADGYLPSSTTAGETIKRSARLARSPRSSSRGNSVAPKSVTYSYDAAGRATGQSRYADLANPKLVCIDDQHLQGAAMSRYSIQKAQELGLH